MMCCLYCILVYHVRVKGISNKEKKIVKYRKKKKHNNKYTKKAIKNASSRVSQTRKRRVKYQKIQGIKRNTYIEKQSISSYFLYIHTCVCLYI